MGWLFQRDPIDDPLAYLMAKYNFDCATHTLQTLDGARAGNTVYLAVRSIDKNTGCSYVFAAVILIRNSKKDGFGYKDQDEGMGPHQYDCPQRIMRLLSPIADLPNARYSADWRAGVAAWHDQNRKRRQRRNSLRVGDVVMCQPDTDVTSSAIYKCHYRAGSGGGRARSPRRSAAPDRRPICRWCEAEPVHQAGISPIGS